MENKEFREKQSKELSSKICKAMDKYSIDICLIAMQAVFAGILKYSTIKRKGNILIARFLNKSFYETVGEEIEKFAQKKAPKDFDA